MCKSKRADGYNSGKERREISIGKADVLAIGDDGDGGHGDIEEVDRKCQ